VTRHTASTQAEPRQSPGACAGLRSGAARGSPRQRADQKTDWARLSERSEQSERSEFCARPVLRAPQGSRVGRRPARPPHWSPAADGAAPAPPPTV